MWLKQEYFKGMIEITYLETSNMPADRLTKRLIRQQFEHFKELINITNTKSLIVQGTREGQVKELIKVLSDKNKQRLPRL